MKIPQMQDRNFYLGDKWKSKTKSKQSQESQKKNQSKGAIQKNNHNQ